MDSNKSKHMILSVGLPFLRLLLLVGMVSLACRLPTPDQYWEMTDKELDEYINPTETLPSLERQQDLGTATPSITTPSTPSIEEELFKVSSQGGADSGPTVPTTFTISESWLVTGITTYHWNNGQGVAEPGTIGLRAVDGTTYGPWQATGTPGQGEVPNAYWSVNPNIVVPPGTYTVLDSDPATWATNAETGGVGMAWGTGIRQGNP